MFEIPEVDEIEAKHPGSLELIMEEIGEQLWDRDRTSPLEKGEDGYVWLTDVQARNACNHVLTGSFWLGGVEYSFEADSGDWNGWVWRSISADGPIPEIKIEHTKWALVPRRDLIADAIYRNKGPFLILKWDALLSREPYKSMSGKYAYDRHFQPGSCVENYWRDKAAEGSFELASQEEADEIRARLATVSKEVRHGRYREDV